MNVKVELDIFSGSANPAWTLSPEDSKKLISMLDSLPEEPNKESMDALGYRGFIVNIAPGKAGTDSYRAHIFQGTICIGSTNEKKCYRDLHGLENWLLKQASERGFDV